MTTRIWRYRVRRYAAGRAPRSGSGFAPGPRRAPPRSRILSAFPKNRIEGRCRDTYRGTRQSDKWEDGPAILGSGRQGKNYPGLLGDFRPGVPRQVSNPEPALE